MLYEYFVLFFWDRLVIFKITHFNYWEVKQKAYVNNNFPQSPETLTA